MKIISRPARNPREEADPNRRLADSIAQEVWSLYGQGTSIDWAGAERHLRRVIGWARQEARRTAVVTGRGTVSGRASSRLVGRLAAGCS